MDQKSLLHVALEKWYEQFNEVSFGSIRATSSGSNVGLKSPSLSSRGISSPNTSRGVSAGPSSAYLEMTSDSSEALAEKAAICRLLLTHNAEKYFDDDKDKDASLYLEEFLFCEQDVKRKLPYDAEGGASTPHSYKRTK
jgi:hypothetical protein